MLTQEEEEKKRKEEEDERNRQYSEAKDIFEKRHRAREKAQKHFEEMLIKECEMQYEHWKASSTELQRAQGMRDYEKARRDADFRRDEMNQLKISFARVADVSTRKFDMKTTRIGRD